MEQEKVWDAIGMPWKKFRNWPVKEVVEFLDGKTGKVLDLGCGSGRNFIKKKELKFYGVDFSQGMLDKAKERGIEDGFDVELVKSKVDKIPFNDEFFDVGIFSATLHCVDSAKTRGKSLKELFRVLKPGAEALISVWGRGSPRIKGKEKECFIPWTGGDKKYFRYTYIYDRDELEREIKKVGFEIVSSNEDMNISVVARKGIV